MGEQNSEERRAGMEAIPHALEGVRVGLSALATAIEDLATKDDVALTDRKARRRMIVAVVLVLAAFALLAVPIHQNRSTIGATRATDRRVLECTTDRPGSRAADPAALRTGTTVPNYDCRLRGQAQTGQAVGELALAFLDALVCADEHDGAAVIESCFASRSAERAKAKAAAGTG